MSTSPLISIITAAYNSSEYIEFTYASLARQTHKNWEWLVTDDCSSDNTLEILQKISRIDTRVKPARNQINSGAAVSRNNSISRATGDFLAFIDSDDLWVENKLETQIEFMNRGNIDFSFTAYNIVDQNGGWGGKRVDYGRVGSFGYDEMLRKAATLGCSTVMLKRSAFPDISMPLIRTGQDYALWLKLLRNGKRAHIIGETLTSYRITPNSISRNKIKKAMRQWQIYREIEKIPIFYSIFCFSFYVFRAIFRR